MKDTRKKIIWIVAGVVGFLLVMGLAVGALMLMHGTDKSQDGSKDADGSSVEVIVQPRIEQAETLKAEASAALREEKYDEATQKYEAAKALYVAADDEIHASELQMQIDLVAQVKASHDKAANEAKNPGPLPVGRP